MELWQAAERQREINTTFAPNLLAAMEARSDEQAASGAPQAARYIDLRRSGLSRHAAAEIIASEFGGTKASVIRTLDVCSNDGGSFEDLCFDLGLEG
jgi:hypothetical protein